MLLANIPLVIGDPFLNMYSLLSLLIFPEFISTPGMYTTSVVPFLPLIGNIFAIVPLPFSVPLIEPFLRLTADS